MVLRMKLVSSLKLCTTWGTNTVRELIVAVLHPLVLKGSAAGLHLDNKDMRDFSASDYVNEQESR